MVGEMQAAHTIPDTNSPLAARAERQLATYWRVRIHKTIERLEYEARRMLALESELSTFAEEYYATIGAAVTRLTAIEEQLVVPPSRLAGRTEAAEFSQAESQRETRAARKIELKARYRTLAREIHPDRTMMIDGTGSSANRMQQLNAAYEEGDLAALLRIEAQMLLNRLEQGKVNANALETALSEVSRAADTYASSYRELLNSPLNELLLRSLSAQHEGWNWMDAVLRNVERRIEEKERALVIANIAAIGQWRDGARAV